MSLYKFISSFVTKARAHTHTNKLLHIICNANFLQIYSNEETTSSTIHLGQSEGEYIFSKFSLDRSSIYPCRMLVDVPQSAGHFQTMMGIFKSFISSHIYSSLVCLTASHTLAYAYDFILLFLCSLLLLIYLCVCVCVCFAMCIISDCN